MSSLKDTILVKDKEIEKLQLLKDLKNVYPSVNSENPETTSEWVMDSIFPIKGLFGKKNNKSINGSSKNFEGEVMIIDLHMHILIEYYVAFLTMILL